MRYDSTMNNPEGPLTRPGTKPGAPVQASVSQSHPIRPHFAPVCLHLVHMPAPRTLVHRRTTSPEFLHTVLAHRLRRPLMVPPWAIRASLHIEPIVHTIDDDLRLPLRLHVPAHHAKAQPRRAVARREARESSETATCPGSSRQRSKKRSTAHRQIPPSSIRASRAVATFLRHRAPADVLSSKPWQPIPRAASSRAPRRTFPTPHPPSYNLLMLRPAPTARRGRAPRKRFRHGHRDRGRR